MNTDERRSDRIKSLVCNRRLSAFICGPYSSTVLHVRQRTFYCAGATQIAAPSKELAPPISIVRFDCTLLYGKPGCAPKLQLPTAGSAFGTLTLIWYRPTCPGVRPA